MLRLRSCLVLLIIELVKKAHARCQVLCQLQEIPLLRLDRIRYFSTIPQGSKIKKPNSVSRTSLGVGLYFIHANTLFVSPFELAHPATPVSMTQSTDGPRRGSNTATSAAGTSSRHLPIPASAANHQNITGVISLARALSEARAVDVHPNFAVPFARMPPGPSSQDGASLAQLLEADSRRHRSPGSPRLRSPRTSPAAAASLSQRCSPSESSPSTPSSAGESSSGILLGNGRSFTGRGASQEEREREAERRKNSNAKTKSELKRKKDEPVMRLAHLSDRTTRRSMTKLFKASAGGKKDRQ